MDIETAALRLCPVAVVDFETTGPDPKTCLPVSVAVAHMDLGRATFIERLHTRINPGVPIPEEATAVHGITDEMVQDAPSPEEALQQLLPHLDGRIFMAYNAAFDWTILRRLLGSADDLVTPLPVLCPFVWARHVDKYEKGKRLVDVVARRGLPVGEAHDAMADVLMTCSVARWLLRDLKVLGNVGHEIFDDLAVFLAWQSGAALQQEADFAAYRARAGKPVTDLPWHELLGVDSEKVLDEAAATAGRGR